MCEFEATGTENIDAPCIAVGICNRMKALEDCPLNISERACLDCRYIVDTNEEEPIYNNEEIFDELDH